MKEKNIVEQGKGKIKLIYVLNKGIVARNNVGDIMFFQFGQVHRDIR